MFSSIEFFIVEAFRSLRRSTLMSMVAVITITVSLIIFGFFLLSTINMGNIVGTISSRLDLVAYTSKDLSLDDAAAIQIKLSKLPGVEKVEFTSKAEAWTKFKTDFGGKFSPGRAHRGQPPAAYLCGQGPQPRTSAQRGQDISDLDVIDEVRYSGKLIEQMKSLVGAVRFGGMAMVILLSLATLLIVVNTIRLTVIARETDIYIMKLVGATDSFVKWPFIIEGLIMGIIGGMASFLALKISYDSTVMRLAQALPFLPMVSDQMLLTSVYAAMIFGGMALGVIGGYISVSRALRKEG